MAKRPDLISILVPVLNEEHNVEPLYQAVVQAMEPLSEQVDIEFVFTDNHSSDNTFAKLQSLAKQDPRVRVFRFSRNVGFQHSIFTGYRMARGDAAVQIDCDLQDPPTLIPEFVKKWQQGARVVYGVRSSRREFFLITAVRKVFYRLINLLSEDDLPLDAGDFRLLDRCVVNALAELDDSQPYLRGTIATMGFDQVGVPYSRSRRERGASKFGFKDLFQLAVDGILNHSTVPLRVATYTGLFVSFLTLCAIVLYVVGKLYFKADWPAGFATTAVLLLFSLSLNAIFLGIIGEYLGRIYKQVKKPPRVIIENTIDNAHPDSREQKGSSAQAKDLA